MAAHGVAVILRIAEQRRKRHSVTRSAAPDDQRHGLLEVLGAYLPAGDNQAKPERAPCDGQYDHEHHELPWIHAAVVRGRPEVAVRRESKEPDADERDDGQEEHGSDDAARREGDRHGEQRRQAAEDENPEPLACQDNDATGGRRRDPPRATGDCPNTSASARLDEEELPAAPPLA